ncbi:MAG: hypothetical protein WC484_07115, partial [Candidatus Omnitrophota bacterium]
QNFNTDLIIVGGTFTGATGTVNIGRNLTITSGAMNMGAQTINVGSDTTFSGGTLTSASGTKINITGNLFFSGGTADLTDSAVDIDGNFYWSGTYLAKSPTLFQLAGNWSRTGGDLTRVMSPDTVEFNGSADQSYYDSQPGGIVVVFYNATYSGHHTLHFYSDLCVYNMGTITYSDGWLNMHGNNIRAYPGATFTGAGVDNGNIIP